jgi:hypothetical protein
MNITAEQDFDIKLPFKEKNYKLGRNLEIGKDLELVGEPEYTMNGFMYKFIAKSERAKKWFKKLHK